MRLYRIGAAWRGTQVDAKAEAKSSGEPWLEVEVPTDKAGLLAFLNGQGHAPTAQPAPILTVDEALTAQVVPEDKVPLDTLIDAIHAAEGARFGNILSAALCRLGELGREGMAALRDREGFNAYHRGLIALGMGPRQ